MKLEMKAAQLLAGVQVFRVKLKAAIDKHDITFLRRLKIAFTPKSSTYQSGMVFGSGRSEATVRGGNVTHRVSSVSESNSGVQGVDRYN